MRHFARGPRSAFPARHRFDLFNLWFGFIFCLILTIWGLVGYAAYRVVNDPSLIGQFIGQAVDGYTGRRP